MIYDNQVFDGHSLTALLKGTAQPSDLEGLCNRLSGQVGGQVRCTCLTIKRLELEVQKSGTRIYVSVVPLLTGQYQLSRRVTFDQHSSLPADRLLQELLVELDSNLQEGGEG